MTDERINTGYAALQTDSDDVPIQVSGVALGDGDITHGGSGKKTLWPGETLRDAPLRGSDEALEGQPLATDTDHTADAPQAQTPSDAVRGQIDWAGYKEGVGVLYEGEVDDPDIARSVENGRLEVSPLVSREIEALEGDVAEKYEELGYDVDEADYVATNISKWRDIATVVSGASPSNEITVGGSPMKAEALSAAIDGVKDHTETDPAESGTGAGGEDPQSDDGETPSSAAGETTETMSDNDLSETEKAVLSAAEDLEEPVEALEEYATAEQPRLVEQDEYEAMQDNIESVRGVMEDALTERTDLKESTVEALSFEALRSEFETEDGDLDAEALVQHPETGDPESEPESGVEALGEDADVEKAEALMADYETFGTEALKEDITDALGVSDFEEATEVLD